MIGAVTALSEEQFFGILTIFNDQTLVVALKMRELEQQMKGLDTTLIRQELRKALSELAESEKKASDMFDVKVAKRMAQLLGMKGHEGMYDTGTKPAGSN